MTPQIEFVFGRQTPEVNQSLTDFWATHLQSFQQEIISFRSSAQRKSNVCRQPRLTVNRQINRRPAAISRDKNGAINGLVFVVLKELDSSLDLGSHAYFQRIYIPRQFRNFRLANQLFICFLDGFDQAIKERDHRAKILLSENVNPKLQNIAERRYFSRAGFKMLGGNELGGEIWIRPLKTAFCF